MEPELRRRLTEVFRRGVKRSLPEEEFEVLAREVFRHQFETNPVYRAFCEARGRTPSSVESWRDIPAVPTRAFKALRLVSGDPAAVRLVFRTSGTSRGTSERGEHHVLDPELYREALLPNFVAHLLPDGARLPLLSLIPPPEEVPDSSLSFMIGVVRDALAAPGGGFFLDPSGRLGVEDFTGALRAAEAEGTPVLLVATAFALVHGLDALAERGLRVRLPDGSRLMETGGYKGRSRELSRADLYAAVEEHLGLPPARVVNEYGMTEMLSQFYEPVLPGGCPEGVDARFHVSPPWVRTRVLDPATLDRNVERLDSSYL